MFQTFRRLAVSIVVTAALTSIPAFSALAQMQNHNAPDHSGHKSPPGHPPCETCDVDSKHDRTERPFEFGSDILAAMQEMVMLLEGKPDTDWDKFNLERLYTHLVDMKELSGNTAIGIRQLEDGLEASLSGPPRTMTALNRVIPEQAITLGRIHGWDSAVTIKPDRVVLTVTSIHPSEVKHIKGLGFMGLMATGTGHHQPFHLALARGETQGAWPREEYIANPRGGTGKPRKMGASGNQPYAGMEKRKIKALSEDRIEGLSTGKGIGYALAAELNNYPGPSHVLDMAKMLGLSDERKNKIQTLFDGMKGEAIALGKMIVEKEAALDRAFADGKIDPDSLEAMVAGIARLEGQLRTVHLTTHLQTKSILSSHQVMLYNRSRGYSGQAAKTMEHRMQ